MLPLANIASNRTSLGLPEADISGTHAKANESQIMNMFKHLNGT